MHAVGMLRRLLASPEFTGIRRVHESALVAHETVEIPPSARETLTEVLAADLQQLRPDRIAHVEDLAEDVRQALLPIEAKEHPGGAGEHCPVHEEPCVRQRAARVWQVQVGYRVEAVAVLPESQ